MQNVVQCPDCNYQINIEGGEVGDYFECDKCFCELILSSLEPPKASLIDEEK
ncbi:MAG: lysine biosynthesis protein LysW [Candidatus Altimarinota bacterium]